MMMHDLALCFYLMFSLFKITKSYQNVIKKGLILVSVVNVNIMVFVLELKFHKGRPTCEW